MRTVALAVIFVVAFAVPASAQWVYMNDYPGGCNISSLFFPIPDVAPRYIYVLAPGEPDVAGATFRIQSDAMGPEDISSVTPSPGVTIVDGDLFSGITLSWSPHEMLHEAVLTVDLISSPPYQPGGEWGGTIWTENVTLATAGGGIACEATYTSTDINIDCFGVYGYAIAPDTVDVGVGVDTHFMCTARVSGPGGGASITFEDPSDWIVAFDPPGVGASCQGCVWDVAHVDVTVAVPDGTPAHTLYSVIMRMTWTQVLWQKTIVLRTIAPVATEATSFGKMKALYRKSE